MKVWLRITVALFLGLLTFSTVSAHAKLIKSSPAPSSVVGNAPTQVQLWFDEAVELNFSEVQVVDSKKQRVDTGELQPVAGDPNSVIVPLKPTGDGTYNVIWKILSATDGHITRGVFAFGVGNTAGVVIAPVDGTQAAPSELSPLSAVIRWVSLLAMLALLGGFVFRFYLLEPSLQHIEVAHEVRAVKTAKKVARTRWHQLTLLAFVLFFAGNVAEVAVQANTVAGNVSFASLQAILLGSRFGQLWFLRVGIIAACAVVLWLESRRGKLPQLDLILIVLANIALFTRSLNSHSAAGGNFSLPVISDWLHLFGVAVWVGGLCYFAWLMPFVWRALEPKARSAWIAHIIPQFSILGLCSTIVIALTGIYNTTQQIPALDILTTRVVPSVQEVTQGTYSETLLIKVGFFAVMIGFGALNLLFLSPRFRRFIHEPEKSAGLFSRFRLTVGAEVLLGLSAIFLAGMLTLSVPPRSEPTQDTSPLAQAQPNRPVLFVGYPADAVQVQLEIGPKPDAPTLFTARVTDKQGKALTDLQRVIFNFMYLNEDTGAQNVNAEARGENQYAVEGDYLPLDGMWRIRVTVRRQGLEDQAVDFAYYIEPATPISTAPVANAQVELKRAQQKMNSLTALRSRQELNDGANGVAISLYDYQAPDKTKFTILGQGESIAIGADQYYLNSDGQWTKRGRVENFVFPKFDFADTAISTRSGRADKPNGTPAQIVLFDTPNTSGTELIHYAYWLADDDKRVLQLGMVTTSHYMIQTYSDFNSPEIAINPPSNVLPAPTAIASGEGASIPLSTAVQGLPRPRGFITGDLEGDGALIMVVVGVVALLIGSGGRRTRSARFVTLGVGAASVILGIGLFVDAVNGSTAALQNIPVNTVRASTGQQIYDQNCAVCHGAKGYGDGPGAAALPVKPFDLTTHVLLHDEQYLYATILNGRGYMPAWGSHLSQDQILDVIAYTRLLARNAQQGASNATPRPGFTPQP